MVKGHSSNSRCSSDKVNRNNVTENKVATMGQLISNTDKDLENTMDANPNSNIKKWTDSKEKGKEIEETKIKDEDKDCGKNSLNPLDQSTLLNGRIFVCNKDSNDPMKSMTRTLVWSIEKVQVVVMTQQIHQIHQLYLAIMQ